MMTTSAANSTPSSSAYESMKHEVDALSRAIAEAQITSQTSIYNNNESCLSKGSSLHKSCHVNGCKKLGHNKQIEGKSPGQFGKQKNSHDEKRIDDRLSSSNIKGLLRQI